MAKSDKELAVELAGMYLQGIYSSQGRPNISMNEEMFKRVLNACYEAVQNLPDDLPHKN